MRSKNGGYNNFWLNGVFYSYKKRDMRKNNAERCMKCWRYISEHKNFFNCKAKIESGITIINDPIIIKK